MNPANSTRAPAPLRVLAVLICCLSPCASASLRAQDAALPAPTGPHPIGRITALWPDPTRQEVLAGDTTTVREVGAVIWYPAQSSSAPAAAAYVPGLESLASPFSPDELALVRQVRVRAVAGVSPRAGRHPVVIFSPGAGTIPSLYTALAEDLASHGFIVAVLAHPYDDKAVRLSNGQLALQVEPPPGDDRLAFFRERVQVRAADLRFFLTRLAQPEGDVALLADRIDMRRVAAAGHSAGGLEAVLGCTADARFSACINLDGLDAGRPAPFQQPTGPSQPFLFLQKPFAALPNEPLPAARRRIAALRERGASAFRSLKRGRSYRVTLEGASHASFSDETALTQPDATALRVLGATRDYVRRFLMESLVGIGRQGLSSAGPDQVEVFHPRRPRRRAGEHPVAAPPPVRDRSTPVRQQEPRD